MEPTFPFKSAYSEELVGKAVAAHPEQSAQSRLHEDVLTHLTKSAVASVSDTLHLGLDEDTSKSTATWIIRAAKSVPLFCPAGRGLRAAAVYGSAATFYGASEVKWGDSAENVGKDAVLGSLKGIGLKGSMDFIGAKMHGAGFGIDKKFWAAPAQGVAFGITGTATEVGLSRSTYKDEKGNFQGIGYGLAKTVDATANVQNLAVGAATFTLGAGGMKLLQTSAIAKAAPGLVGNRIFQNSFTGFSFGAFSGMAEEAQKQVVEGKFSGWELHKFDYEKIGKHGLFAASADAFGAAIGAKIGAPPVTVENVKRIDKPANETIKDRGHLNEIVEQPLRRAVANLWDKNIDTTGSGMFHLKDRRWDPLGSSIHIGEYQPPYYVMKLGKDIRSYEPVYDARVNRPETQQPDGQKTAYIVINEASLSPENQVIARRLGRVRTDGKIEVHVPVEPNTPAKQVDQAMLALANQFRPQPMNWGFKTPLQFYRETMKVETGVPTSEWLSETVNSPEFKKQGLVHDAQRNLIFQSKELADKFNAAPPPEPTWYRGPETFGTHSRGGWRQAYNQFAVHMYTPEGQGVQRPDPKTARMPDKNFDIADLAKPENASYYLSSKERFFELFGTKAYDALADRHWLELRNKSFESVERYWPSATVEKDRALALGTSLLARATERHGYFTPENLWTIELMVPRYLWRDPAGRRLSTEEVLYGVNKIYYDMFQEVNASGSPFDHNFGKKMVDYITGPDGDRATDKREYRHSRQLSLDNVMTNGWEMKVDSRYVPLLREVAQKQKEGMIPERFDKTTGEDGMDVYTPVYREATVEERSIPISELVKNLKIVDYGFKNNKGPVLGKVSLASHDVHDHARVFWLLEQAGMFKQNPDGRGYSHLMGKLEDPQSTNIFRREGELVASVAYDWRNYFDVHPDYQPQVDLKDIQRYFLHADKQGIPLSRNQMNALNYVEELMRTDPQGQRPETKKLRHIIGGVWQETLEQKRKTDNSLWQREDGSYQRMSATNPEYLAFVIEASRVLQNHGPMMSYALNQNNLKMEKYLRDVAGSAGDEPAPTLRFTPEDVKTAIGEESIVPADTREWLLQHPGFNTRRAPIRNWLIGQQSEFDAMEIALAEWNKRLEEDHRRFIREQLFRDRFDLD